LAIGAARRPAWSFERLLFQRPMTVEAEKLRSDLLRHCHQDT
jgi:hypothetical protein